MENNGKPEGQNGKTNPPPLEDKRNLTQPNMTENEQKILERRMRISDKYGAVPVSKILEEEGIQKSTYYRDLEWIRKNKAQEWVDEMGRDRLIFNYKEIANQLKMAKDLIVERLSELNTDDDMYDYKLTRLLQQLNDTIRLEKNFLADVPTLHSLKEAVKQLGQRTQKISR